MNRFAESRSPNRRGVNAGNGGKSAAVSAARVSAVSADPAAVSDVRQEAFSEVL